MRPKSQVYVAKYNLCSDEIDEQLRKEREVGKGKKKPVKLLLLGASASICSGSRSESFAGQSESGKTATLKSMLDLYNSFALY